MAIEEFWMWVGKFGTVVTGIFVCVLAVWGPIELIILLIRSRRK